MRKPATIGLVLVLAVGIFIVGYSFCEPRHGGRTLTSWLEQATDAASDETNRIFEAQEAIRAIGAGKSLPTLFKLIRAKDGPVKLWLMEKAENSRTDLPRWPSAMERQFQAIGGFEALGTNAAPAVGELTKMLADNEHAFLAMRCLEQIGKPAEAILCQCLTNNNAELRSFAVSALASVTDDVEVYLDRITPRLQDTESAVRFATVQAIGAQSDSPQLAVPLLVPALNDADDGVCDQAATALAGFGTNAMSAFTSLTNLVYCGQPRQMLSALKALPAVAPVESLSVLSNAVMHGDPLAMGASLKSLRTLVPDLALSMAQTQLGSADARRRVQTVGVFASYDPATPGISAALKLAAGDDDPVVARQALSVIRQILQKRKDKQVHVLCLPGEPGFQGRALGEWLSLKKARQPLTAELFTNAVEALRQMGTNAVVALCARLRYRDPQFGIPDMEVSIEAVNALVVVGDSAKAAFPTLTAMMESNDSHDVLFAMMATLGTGTNAVPFLMRGLTNQFADVRNEAAGYLAGEWSAEFPEQRKQVIPFLVSLLNDPDESVRQNAINQLLDLDPATAAKAGLTAKPNPHSTHVHWP